MKTTTKPSLTLGSFSFKTPFWIVILTVAGLAIRVIRLDLQPLWWDEGYSVFFATRDWLTMLARTAVDIHPPLYYALLKLWMGFLGKDAVTLRLFSVLIGAATIPIGYVLARRLLNQRAALVTALLLAVSPFFVYYSQEVRMYGLVTLLSAGSVYLFCELLMFPTGRRANVLSVAYVLATVASLYTQYYAVTIFAFEILAVLLLLFRNPEFLSGRRGIRYWVSLWAAVVIFYLPWVIFAGAQLLGYVTAKVAHEAYAPLDPIQFLSQHLVALSVGHLSEWTALGWFSIGFGLLAILGAISTTTRTEEAIGPISSRFLITLYLIVPVGFVYLLNLAFPFHPVRVERLLLIAAPAFCMLLARGIVFLLDTRRWLGAMSLLAILIASSLSLYDFYTIPRYSDDDYRPLIKEVQSLALAHDSFIALYPWQIGYLESYCAGAPLDVFEPPANDWINNRNHMEQGVDGLLKRGGRLWLPALQTLGRVLEDSLESYLKPNTYSVVDTWYSTTRLELFAKFPDGPAIENQVVMQGLPVTFGILRNPQISGGDVLPLWFEWGELSGRGLHFSIRIADRNGNVWAQEDRALEEGRQRVGLVVPYGLPQGTYTLWVKLYGGSSTDKSEGKELSLAQVDIFASDSERANMIQDRLTIDFSNGMELIGYSGPKVFTPGEPAAIVLYWRANRAIDGEYKVVTRLADGKGNVVGESSGAPARGMLETSSWSAGTVIRDPQQITLKGSAPDGETLIQVGLVDAQSGAPVKTTTGANTGKASTAIVKGRPHYFGAPQPSRKTSFHLGDVATLIGYDLSRVESGTRIVLYWQSQNPVEQSYVVFVHMAGADGRIIGQSDRVPGDGALPTSSWVKDEYLVDEHFIPADLGQTQSIQLGLYDPITSTRLPVFGVQKEPLGDHVDLRP